MGSREIAAEERNLRDIIKRWYEAENRKDVDASLSFYTPDAVFQPRNTPEVTDMEAMRRSTEETFEALESIRGEVTRVGVAGSRDLAYVSGTTHMVLKGDGGPVEEEGKWLSVWKKVDGDWKCAIISYSSDKPT